jgi:uncharacterized protein YuzE
MKIDYFADTDSVMATFRENADYDSSEEIFDGFVVDFDTSGRPMGFDVEGASKFFDRSWLRIHTYVDAPQPTVIRDSPARKKT